MMMSSECVLLGVAHRDRDFPQLGLSKSPVEPRSFALLVVLQDHSRRRRRSFCSRSMHGSSTDTRASRYDLWAQSANYIGRTSILANQAYKRQNLRLSRPPTSVGLGFYSFFWWRFYSLRPPPRGARHSLLTPSPLHCQRC